MEIPRWGRVVAQPHQFLIQMRNGRVRRNGQGASCFKWPGDSVALVPTSIAKLSFLADQVTSEKVGVEVTGLAVYRIVEPMLAFRMIDGDTARLGEILRDMFVGATRRIVAGLSLEACITHRKERVARALMEEISPVLAGNGGMGDVTSQGWGIVLDTIEIQNVRVLSEEVFSRLQAPFRESLSLEALRARERVEEEQARLVVERRRAEEQGRREMMAEEEARILAERKREAEAARHRAAMLEAVQNAELAREAQREDAAAERRKREFEAELGRAEQEALAERGRARIQMETRREAGELEAALLRASRDARCELSEGQLREIMLTDTMPRVAEAFRGSFDQIHVTSASGEGANLFAFLSAGLGEVLRATRD